jgi:hypothetical protein
MISGFRAFPEEAELSVSAKSQWLSVRQYYSQVCTRRGAGPRIRDSMLDWNRVPSKDQRLLSHERFALLDLGLRILRGMLNYGASRCRLHGVFEPRNVVLFPRL